MVELAGGPGDTVVVRGSSGVAAAWGLHYYLTQFTQCHVSWDAVQLSLPARLPAPALRLVARDPLRYHQNVCTPGYSFVWWQVVASLRPAPLGCCCAVAGLGEAHRLDGAQRSQHPTCLHRPGEGLAKQNRLIRDAQEVVWSRVWSRLGLSPPEMEFPGPAFLPWGRMGNMVAWAGPPPPAWHKLQTELQHRILAR